MVLLKILLCERIFTTFIFIIYLNKHHFVATEEVNKILGSTKNERNVSTVSYTDIVLLDEALHIEQSRLLNLKLLQEGYKFNKSSALLYDLTKYVVDCLLHYENDEEKITELAAIMLRPLGQYGSDKGDEISHFQKISAIHEWLKRSILGMSFSEWILNEVRIMKQEVDNFSITHGNIEYLFVNQLHNKTDLGELSAETEKYYLDYLLKEDMPSFLINLLNDEELERLQLINLTSPEFGYLFVGLKVLRSMRLDLNVTWSLDDIEYIGILIEYIIREGNITNIELFELPAKIYYVSTLDANAPPRQFWGLFYDEYFKYLQQGNLISRLIKPLSDWKTRPKLAIQVLQEYDVSEDYLSDYLYHGDSSERTYENSKGVEIPLPSIDNIFEEQNRNVKNSFWQLDNLKLFQVFNMLDKETLEFIQVSKINFVRASFYDKNFHAPLIVTTGAFVSTGEKRPIHLMSDNIALLKCQVDNRERIFALDSQKYEFHFVDFDMEKYRNLFKINDSIEGYKLVVTSISFEYIKEETQAIDALINNLSEIHSKKLYNALKSTGYEATGWQKFRNILIGLIPFYSCVTELSKGNFGDAVLPCGLDIVSLIHFMGHGFKIAYEFGATSVEISAQALKLAAKQATISQMMRQAGKSFVNTGITQIQQTINSQVFKNLGAEFLRGLDPGIALLRLGGIKSIQVIKKASGYLESKFSKLKTFTDKLSEKAEKELSSVRLISADVLQSKKEVLLPDIMKKAAVVKVGTKNGNDILVRIDDETNILFGRKYLEDPSTGTVESAPFLIRDKEYQIKTRKFKNDVICKPFLNHRRRRSDENLCMPNGIELALSRPRILVSDMWSSTKTLLESSILASEVYIRSTRVPYDVLNPVRGGIRPEQAARYDYNMDQYSVYFKNQLDGVAMDWGTPFVATSSDPDAALKMVSEGIIHPPNNQNLGDIVDYLYKVKPNSNFYNYGESLLAAREVCPPHTTRYSVIDYLYGENNIDKYLAKDGIAPDRIMEWAPIVKTENGDVVQEWTKNINYNKEYDSDFSAVDVYTRIAINNSNDAMFMGTNIVQEALGVDKNVARSIIVRRRLVNKLEDWITRYNINKLELFYEIRIAAGFHT